MQLNYRGDKGNLSNNVQHGTSNGMMGSQRDEGGKEGAEFFANFKGRFLTRVPHSHVSNLCHNSLSILVTYLQSLHETFVKTLFFYVY